MCIAASEGTVRPSTKPGAWWAKFSIQVLIACPLAAVKCTSKGHSPKMEPIFSSFLPVKLYPYKSSSGFYMKNFALDIHFINKSQTIKLQYLVNCSPFAVTQGKFSPVRMRLSSWRLKLHIRAGVPVVTFIIMESLFRHLQFSSRQFTILGSSFWKG